MAATLFDTTLDSNQQTLKDRIYIVGLTLVIISFIACTISYYLAIFGLPVFIIGVILVFVSRKSIKTKLLTTILPIMMWYPLSILFFLNYGKTTPETFLIPSDFRGQFRVVYGEKCGINPPIENGRRILQIPNDGILIIRPEFEYGWIDHEYDFVDKNGKRIKIQSTSDTIKNKSLPNIIFAGNGNVPGKMPDGSFSSESPLTYEYVDFVVTYKDIIYNESTKETQRFDSICKALIDSCRASKN